MCKIGVMPLCYVCCGVKNVRSREVVMFLVVSEVIFTGCNLLSVATATAMKPMQVTCNRQRLDEPQPVFPYFCHS